MTLKQFIKHLYVWLIDFPPTHIWVRHAFNDDPPFCLICGAIDKEYKPED